MSQVVIWLPLQALMTSWSVKMTHLNDVVCSIAGQANDDQHQHVTHITSDMTLHVNSTYSHTRKYCAHNYGKKTDVRVTYCSYKLHNSSPGRMLPERSPSLGRPGKRRVWWRFWTTTKVMGGLYSELGSPMPRQAAASCAHTQNHQHSNQH